MVLLFSDGPFCVIFQGLGPGGRSPRVGVGDFGACSLFLNVFTFRRSEGVHGWGWYGALMSGD